MSKDGVWGTENELKPLPYALDEQIAVAAADESWYDQIFKPMRQQKELETIRPGFDGKEHYYSLETGKKKLTALINIVNQRIFYNKLHVAYAKQHTFSKVTI